jgi:hypothetical protein
MAAVVVLGEQQLLQQLKKEGLMLMLAAQQVRNRVSMVPRTCLRV